MTPLALQHKPEKYAIRAGIFTGMYAAILLGLQRKISGRLGLIDLFARGEDNEIRNIYKRYPGKTIR